MNAMTVTNLKCRAFTMILFKAFGLGHLEEEFVIQVVYMMAIIPMIIFFIAIAVESRYYKKKNDSEEQKKEPVTKKAKAD